MLHRYNVYPPAFAAEGIVFFANGAENETV